MRKRAIPTNGTSIVTVVFMGMAVSLQIVETRCSGQMTTISTTFGSGSGSGWVQFPPTFHPLATNGWPGRASAPGRGGHAMGVQPTVQKPAPQINPFRVSTGSAQMRVSRAAGSSQQVGDLNPFRAFGNVAPQQPDATSDAGIRPGTYRGPYDPIVADQVAADFNSLLWSHADPANVKISPDLLPSPSGVVVPYDWKPQFIPLAGDDLTSVTPFLGTWDDSRRLSVNGDPFEPPYTLDDVGNFTSVLAGFVPAEGFALQFAQGMLTPTLPTNPNGWLGWVSGKLLPNLTRDSIDPVTGSRYEADSGDDRGRPSGDRKQRGLGPYGRRGGPPLP
jgi:hypothetical protein